MKRELKIELRKALAGRAFKITIIAELAIILWHIVYVYGLMQQLALEAAPGRFTGKYNLFYWWIAIDCVSAPYALFYTLYPLFACIPYAWSLYNDRKTKYIYQQITRCGKRNYYASKYVAVCVTGGLAVTLPLAIDLMALALFSPAVMPEITFSMPGFSKGGFLVSLYYTYPWLFCGAFLIMEFLWGSAIAAMSFVFALIYERGISGVIMPIFTIYVWDVVASFVKQLYMMNTGKYLELSVLQLLHACTESPNPAWLQLSIVAGILLASGIADYALAAKKNIL